MHTTAVVLRGCNEIYLQTYGTAMGTKLAVSFSLLRFSQGIFKQV